MKDKKLNLQLPKGLRHGQARLDRNSVKMDKNNGKGPSNSTKAYRMLANETGAE